MQSQARVVVIGGGIGGLSALYHLTLEGWSDLILLERDELTSGTTWHSAAQCPGIAFNQLLLLLRDYTLKLYRENWPTIRPIRSTITMPPAACVC